MFGLMNPGRQDRSYRQAYARCCQHQRKIHGVASLAFLSYEATFLYLLAVDSGALSEESLPQTTCCRLRPLPYRTPSAERQVARFCSAVGLLLAWVKLDDDIRDRSSRLAQVVRWLLSNRFRDTFRYFEQRDPAFRQRVAGFLEAHHLLEQRGATITLEDYVRPTADAFGYVFQLMARLPGMHQHGDMLQQLGERVGAAIIAVDCARDWSSDHRLGQYNPLPDGDQSAHKALKFAEDQLLDAIQQCRRSLGERSRLAASLERTRQRLFRYSTRSICQQVQESTQTRMSHWGERRAGTVQLALGVDLWWFLAGCSALALSLSQFFLGCGSGGSVKLSAQDVSAGEGLSEEVAQKVRKQTENGCCVAADGAECCLEGTCEALNCGEGCNGCDGCGSCDCNFS